MTPIFPELPRTLGVYSLTRLLEVRENTELYEARQTHVDRAVVLEVLQPDATREEEGTFLIQARHRGSTGGIPHVADVFESLRAEGFWFLTQELPQGQSLASLAGMNATLTALEICSIISAAAEMYDTYAQAGHAAMPMAPTSIYFEKSGEVHFLSPLVEGKANAPQEQMQALAAALWTLCPQEKAPGLGRTITLLQWLQNGVEGDFLSWQEIKQTADTVINQLQCNDVPENQKSALTRFGERINRHPATRRIRSFTRQWGIYLSISAGIIILLSSMGSLLGLSAPVISPACGPEYIHCQTNGKHERVRRQPVSVQQYADFLQQYEAMTREAQLALISGLTEDDIESEPAEWEAQLQKSPDLPVTGVSYWQAMLYARFHNATLPTANQLQAIRSEIPAGMELEWSRSEAESPLPGIYNGTAYLLVDENGKILPTSSRNWNNMNCGFRIAFPTE
ncbi:MAG: SUMF1/EgtB/PvdO family nonheme iron enzyme [Akkermansia sp.]|nr:SUMF1/EgtB/PvdO family nonheme iron enzyme [Akkermansia sp.]